MTAPTLSEPRPDDEGRDIPEPRDPALTALVDRFANAHFVAGFEAGKHDAGETYTPIDHEEAEHALRQHIAKVRALTPHPAPSGEPIRSLAEFQRRYFPETVQVMEEYDVGWDEATAILQRRAPAPHPAPLGATAITDDDVRRAVCDYNDWKYDEMMPGVSLRDTRSLALRVVLENFAARSAPLGATDEWLRAGVLAFAEWLAGEYAEIQLEHIEDAAKEWLAAVGYPAIEEPTDEGRDTADRLCECGHPESGHVEPGWWTGSDIACVVCYDGQGGNPAVPPCKRFRAALQATP